MGKFQVNFADVEGRDFSAIPRGKYLVEITGAEESEVGADAKKLPPGTPGINWEFTVREPEQYAGRKLWTNHWLHPSTLFALKNLCRASGEYSDEDLESDSFDFDPAELEGQLIVVTVKTREYQGEERNDVTPQFKGVEEWDGGAVADESLLPT